MSKERLEEIEKNLDPLGYGMGGHLISVNDIYRLVEYAKEQTKRVQELEEELQELKKKLLTLTKENNQVNDELIDVFRENKRYREALEEIRGLYPLRNVGYQVPEIRKIVIRALEGKE